MPKREILVFQRDIDAAKRIAAKMFPREKPDENIKCVIETAMMMGMDSLRVVWGEEAENQENAYAEQKIRSDKLSRNEGSASGDMTTDGVPMREGQ